MSRRRAAEKRTILPDHKYKDLVLAKFMNRIMLDGKSANLALELSGLVEEIPLAATPNKIIEWG